MMCIKFGTRTGIGLVIAGLATGLVTIAAPGAAGAVACASGMTMGQFGVCVPATVEEPSSVPPEWRQVSGGDAVDPDSPTSICQAAPPCPEGETPIQSDCECPPR